MPATMDHPTPAGYKRGDLIDLGACWPTTVTWDEQGVCWAVERTRRKSRRPGTVPYRVVATVEDPVAFIEALDGSVDEDPPAPFDSDELTRVVVGLLGYHRANKPEAFDLNCWAVLDDVMAQDPEATDAEVVAALERVVEEQDPLALTRDGWVKVTDLLDTYHSSL